MSSIMMSFFKKLETALTNDDRIKFYFKIVARHVNRNTIARIFPSISYKGRLSTARIRLKAYFIYVLKEHKSILGLGATQQARLLIIFGTFCVDYSYILLQNSLITLVNTKKLRA